jgi:hypothetical protein
MKSSVLFPRRDGRTGHRISDHAEYRPIRTRDLPLPAKVAEYPCRWLARYCARHAVQWEERVLCRQHAADRALPAASDLPAA